MSELKRCPFCGDDVEIIATGLYHWKYAIHHKSKTECILDANAFALPYEKEDAVRMWNTRADRKTENCSEKPNNCEECKHWNDTEDDCADRHGCRTTTEDCSTVKPQNYCDDCLYCDTCDSKEFFYACTSKATISKMEQVDKDEPQTSCKTCRYGEVDEGYVRCAYYSKSTEQDEPQSLEQFRVGLEYHTDTTHFGKVKGENITTNKVEDEPQTERSE